MTFILDPQSHDLFKDLFAFYGTISPNGSILSLTGTIFNSTSTEPEVLIGQKFSDAVFWQSSKQNVDLINQTAENAANGVRSTILLNFRVNSNIKKLVELSLNPLSETGEIFFCAQDVTPREKEIEFHKMRSEQLLYAAESAEIGLWFWDVVEDQIFSTPHFNELFEVPAHELIDLESFFKNHTSGRSRTRRTYFFRNHRPAAENTGKNFV